ncbi:MAG: phosphatidylserine decarboxylase proenzyme [Candidatus Westeberhardia cardiocondylae]|nr:phosphatidylserine decarboxylase proenzyme [Candidatus Westeberhardia cardiocondylae]
MKYNIFEVIKLDKLKIVIQYLLPKHLLTKLFGWIATQQGGWITRLAILIFIRIYNIKMYEAQQQDISTYLTFNDFFTRSLKNNSRPIDHDPSLLVFPADGKILQFGQIKSGYLLQAKEHYYTLETLLARKDSITEIFNQGHFITTYISPGDYHRIHMPCNGILKEMVYIPGELFSVNPITTINIPNIFAKNERVICIFDTNFGIMAQILIGAIIVGGIETIWQGNITPPHGENIKFWTYSQKNATDAVILLKGQEMGKFHLGSTVINVFENNKIQFNNHIHINYTAKVGQYLAKGIQIKKHFLL